MSNKIKLLELDIDTEAILNHMANLKKQIEELKTTQKNLDTSTELGTKRFIEQSVKIKELSEQYRIGEGVLRNLNMAQKDFTTVSILANSEISKEVNTIKEAQIQNKALNKIKGDLNVNIKEEKELLDQINKKIDDNTNMIKANASTIEKLKMNVGNYKDSIIEATQAINPFNGGISGFLQRAQESGGVGALFTNSLKTMTSGMWGLTKATLSFIATPIGAILAVIVGAIMLVKSALSKSEEQTNKLKVAFAGFKGILNAIMSVLKPLADFLINGIVAGMEAATNAAAFFSKELRDQIKLAKEAEKAQQEYNISLRSQEFVVKGLMRDQEKQRQIRDDETKSIKERIDANENLAGLLKTQLGYEIEMAKQGINAIETKMKAEGNSSEELLKQKDELYAKIADTEERITGVESEQLKERNNLLKDANDKQKEAHEKATEKTISRYNAELEAFKIIEGNKLNTLEESLKYYEGLKTRELKINELEYQKGKKNN